MEIFDFLLDIPYLEAVLGVLVASHSIALVIVNLTDTPTDNLIVAKAYRYIEFAAGIFNARKVKS